MGSDRPTGAGVPLWVIWVMIALFLAIIVCANDVAIQGPAPDVTPSPSTSSTG